MRRCRRASRSSYACPPVEPLEPLERLKIHNEPSYFCGWLLAEHRPRKPAVVAVGARAFRRPTSDDTELEAEELREDVAEEGATPVASL